MAENYNGLLEKYVPWQTDVGTSTIQLSNLSARYSKQRLQETVNGTDYYVWICIKVENDRTYVWQKIFYVVNIYLVKK